MHWIKSSNSSKCLLNTLEVTWACPHVAGLALKFVIQSRFMSLCYCTCTPKAISNPRCKKINCTFYTFVLKCLLAPSMRLSANRNIREKEKSSKLHLVFITSQLTSKYFFEAPSKPKLYYPFNHDRGTFMINTLKHIGF